MEISRRKGSLNKLRILVGTEEKGDREGFKMILIVYS